MGCQKRSRGGWVLLADLGLAWELDGYALLDDDQRGVRVLAGGVDGEQVRAAQTEPGLSWALVLEQAAELMGTRL